MACGRAILVSDKVGCAADLVDTGVNGLIFKSGDERDLLEKLTSMLMHKDKVETMGKQSFEKIQSWNYDAVADAILSLV